MPQHGETNRPAAGRDRMTAGPPDPGSDNGTSRNPNEPTSAPPAAEPSDSGASPTAPIAVLEPRLARSTALLTLSILLAIVAFLPGTLATVVTARATMASRTATQALQAGEMDHANVHSYKAAKLRRQGMQVFAVTAAFAAVLAIWMLVAADQLT